MSGAIDRRLSVLVRGFRGRRCLVVGDVILDVFERGRTVRLAPDAPAPVVTDVHVTSSPGGAANVAANLAALGAEVTLLSVVGDDTPGDELLKGLAGTGVRATEVVRRPNRATVVKKRLIAEGAILARVDSGDVAPLEEGAREDFARKAATLAEGAEAVVVSDYCGGIVTQEVADALGDVGHGCVVLDAKNPLRLRWHNLAAATPNHLEAQDALGLPAEADPGRIDAGAVGEALRRKIGAQALAVTLAEEGVTVVDSTGVARLGGRRVANPDVNGAGDTFLATFALALCSGAPPSTAARLGIEAATLAVARPGTAPVGFRELLQRLPEAGRTRRDLEEDLARVRRSGGRVVFTNGCFDLLHRGHLFLLQEARKLGDVLVVGVNSDASARRVKGPGRPVTPEEDRVELLEALPCVDHVLVFDEDTPEALIRRVKPDLHVKGGDHADDRLVEESMVEEFGGEVVVLPLLPGRSASATINRIRSSGTIADGATDPATEVRL
ncbi:MAG: D-glycero-beta-D-manno-heptose 1-phosphate adenylyltransferase [Actinomycetota bacterium]|nr:D-glycero-beta-D-manno-heptose 1-phosphate adenylyltransferase [Actinomycetota bacterium]